MNILIIKTQEKRNRYRFVSAPLREIENVNVTIFEDKRNILSFIYRSFLYAIRNENFDIILIIGGDFKNSFWALLAKIFIKAKVICRLGGDPILVVERTIKTILKKHQFSKYVKLSINLFITRILLRHIDGAIVVNNEFLVSKIKEFAKKDFPITVIPQVAEAKIDSSTMSREPKSDLNLLTVTNLAYEEKYEGVIAIIKHLIHYVRTNKLDTKIIFDILGGGYYLLELNRFLEKYKELPNNLKINVHGYVDALEFFYKSADIFIYCSTMDATPNVLLEAQSYGLALLVNSYEPFYNILLEDVNSLYFDKDDYGSFCSSFAKLFTNKAFRDAMSYNNIENIKKKYSLATVAQKWEELLLNKGMLIK